MTHQRDRKLSGEYLLSVTHALLRSETALAAVRALHGCSERVAVEALVELVHRHRAAGEAVAAIRALEAATSPIVGDALCAALDSTHPSVRLAAVQELQRRRLARGNRSLARSWLSARSYDSRPFFPPT